MKNPQTTIALPFLSHNSSTIGGVPSFCFVCYDLPTNNLTNELTNNCTNWIWTSKKIGLKWYQRGGK